MEEEDVEDDSGGWLMTFADLISLMLTFFILLYSMSVVDVEEWAGVSESMTNRLNPRHNIEELKFTSMLAVETLDAAKAHKLEYLYRILEPKLKQRPELEGILMRQLEDRLILSLPEDALFSAGSIHMTERSQDVIFFLGDILLQIGNKIHINGSSDPTPVSQGSRFHSNWELSLARAMSIAEELRKVGYVYNLNAFGISDSATDDLFRGAEGNVTEQELYRYLRRVDIVVHATAAKFIDEANALPEPH